MRDGGHQNYQYMEYQLEDINDRIGDVVSRIGHIGHGAHGLLVHNIFEL